MQPISKELGDRIIARMCKEHQLPRETAEAILRETLVFLNMVGTNPACPSTPSALVDIGWHTFILYTREYAAYCNAVCGEFIHHCPTDTPELEAVAVSSEATVEFMAANGIVYDPQLWGTALFCDVRGGGGNDGCKSEVAANTQPPYDFGDLLQYQMAGADCDDGRGNCKSCGGGFGKCS
ncbi:MAG: hypothetical protein U0516_03585 [Candidatus Saccharibacteria bacterium]